MPNPTHIRVFLSSPGDVVEERHRARSVLQRIDRTPLLKGRVTIEVVSWDDPDAPAPMDAGLTPQEAVNRGLAKPSDCDLSVVIIWARMGTPLSEPRKPDGSQFLSGTEWEYWDARNAGKPIFLYRKTARPMVDLDDPDLTEKQRQKKLVDRFFSQFTGPDGSLTGGYTSYETADEFEKRLEQDVQSFVRQVLEPQQVRTDGARGPSTPARPTVPESYREWLLSQCSSVELLGLRLKHGQAVRLNNVYVPIATLSAREPTPERREPKSGPHPGEERDALTLLLHRFGESSLYVSGDPGSGKSTFCRWVSWLACDGDVPPPDVEAAEELQEHFPDSLGGRLPLLVPLRDFCTALPDGSNTTSLSRLELEGVLKAWIDRTAPGGLSGETVVAHIRAGSALLLFDGVDEVPPGRRDLLLASLSQAVPEWTRANRVLVTSRPYGLSDADVRQLGLSAGPIQALAPQMQDLLVRRWFRILADNAAAGESSAADMLQQVRGQAWLAPLLANPLLLTAACIVFNDGKRLPQDKHELYDRLVDVVLSNRMKDSAHIARVRDRLTVLAHGMHTGTGLGENRSSPQAQATDDEIDRMLREYRKASAWVETDRREVHEDREELVGRTGVFVPQGEHRAGFYHLSFQEFFAAQRLADGEPNALAQTLLDRGSVPAWRNTLSFLYGKFLAANSTPDRPVRLLTALIDTLDAGVPSTLVVTADCLEILTRRGYGLAQPIEDRLRRLCVTAMSGPAEPRVRCEVGAALGRIGDPRFRLDAWYLPADPMLGFIEIPAGPFTMGSDPKKDKGAFGGEQPAHSVTLPAFYMARFPVTVAQFRAYVEDAGITPGDPDCLRGVANHPVVWVSWHEALAYCAWLTKKMAEGPETPDALRRVLRPTGKGDKAWVVTLASEAEWEKAARGTDGRIYPWGSKPDPDKANYNEAGIGGTSAVGCFPGGASPYGVEELSGNVWEWTRSLWGKDWDKPTFTYRYAPGDGREDLSASDDILRVVRGGSFYNTVRDVRAAFRLWYGPDNRLTNFGFRVAVSPFFSDR